MYANALNLNYQPVKFYIHNVLHYRLTSSVCIGARVEQTNRAFPLGSLVRFK